MRRVTSNLARRFVCSRGWGNDGRNGGFIKKLRDEMQRVNRFYLGGRLDTNGGRKVEVTAILQIA